MKQAVKSLYVEIKREEYDALRARVAEMESTLLRVVDTGELSRVQHEDLEADVCALTKAQQPSAGVVLPEQEGSAAQKSFWAGFEACACGLSGMNIRAAWNEFKSSEQFARLNPCRAQSVPDGYVMVPVEATRAQRNAVWMHPDLAASLYRSMVLAAPSAQQKED